MDSGAVFAGVYAAVAAEDDGDAYEDGADEDEDEEEINKQYRVSGSGRSLSLAAIRQVGGLCGKAFCHAHVPSRGVGL